MNQRLIFSCVSLLYISNTNVAHANYTNNHTGDQACCASICSWVNKQHLRLLIGEPAPEFRLALGLWSVHTKDNDTRNGQNNLLGFSYKGFFLGTFVNSYYRRAYTTGMQRYWLTRPLTETIHYELGYRFGLVSGYKGYNVTGIQALKHSNVVPFIQFVLGFNYKNFGWEISTPNLSVISTGFYIRFQ